MAITKQKFIGMTSATAPRAEASVLHEFGMLAFQRGDIEVALKFMSRTCVDTVFPGHMAAELLTKSGLA